MTKILPLLKQLIDLVAEFDGKASANETHLPGFIHWLLQRDKQEADALFPKDKATNGEVSSPPEPGLSPDVVLTMTITHLFRYAKHYTKKALENSPLSTLDDFTFLLTLRYQGSMTKSELTSQHLLEITSGIEIIKRLSRQGLITTFDDPNDRRSKQVAITEAGIALLDELLIDMKQVSRLVAGNVTPEEMHFLLPILTKLHHFHGEIHKDHRKSDLQEITDKFL